MFTAGIGAYFYLVRRTPDEGGWQNGRTRGQLSRFLVTRGLWLMLLEVTVMRLAYNFDLDQSYPFFLLVLWGLGLCMIVLAALAWLPIPALAALSVATIVLHHLADGIRAQQFGTAAPFWHLIHQVGAFRSPDMSSLRRIRSCRGSPSWHWVFVSDRCCSSRPSSVSDC